MPRSRRRPSTACGPRPRRSLVLLLCALVPALAAVSSPAGAAHQRVATDDPLARGGLQWGFERVGAEAAWARTRGEGVTIAVVDSGVDLEHPDLRNQVVGHISCIGTGGDPRACRGPGRDDHGHGTHVAGIAAAEADNGEGIVGVAPGARILAVRVLRESCSGQTCSARGSANDVAAGIRWAVEQGADVINLSLGGGALQTVIGCAFCPAIEEAWDAGVISVVAAGNDGILPSGVGDTPAVVVTATTREERRASYSNRSGGLLRAARWPVAAPGGEAERRPEDCGVGGNPAGILSTYLTGDGRPGYACLAGTSMAAPHVSGALALLLAAGLEPQAAIERLLGTATDLGRPGRDDEFGYGRIDLARAFADLGPATGTPPMGAPTTTAPPPTATPTTPPPETPPPPPPPETAPPDTPAPEVPPPETAAPPTPLSETAAPPPAEGAGEEDRGWLVATAVVALMAAATATAAGAWEMRRSG